MMNRAFLKTGTYCVMHFVVAILVAFALTRNWHVALAVGTVEPFVQTFAFALHERVWSRTGEKGQAQAVAGACAHARFWPARDRQVSS
jgi:uncharacterized membrane protein